MFGRFRRKGKPDDSAQKREELRNDSFYEEPPEVVERVPRVAEPTAKPPRTKTYNKGGFPVTVVETGWKPAAYPLDRGTVGMLTVAGQRVPFVGGSIVPIPPKSTLEIVDRQERVMAFRFFISVETKPEVGAEERGRQKLTAFDSVMGVTQENAKDAASQFGEDLVKEEKGALLNIVRELADFRQLIQRTIRTAARASVRIEIHVEVAAHVSDGTGDETFAPGCILDFFLGIENPQDYCRSLAIKVIQQIIDRNRLYAEDVVMGNRTQLESALTEVLRDKLLEFNVLVGFASVTRIEYEKDYQDRLEAIAQITKEAQAKLQATFANFQQIVLEAAARKEAIIREGEGKAIVAQMIVEKAKDLDPQAQGILIATLLGSGAGLNIFAGGSGIPSYLLSQEVARGKQ